MSDSKNWELDQIEESYKEEIRRGTVSLNIKTEYVDDLGIKRKISKEKYQEILNDRNLHNEGVRRKALKNRNSRINSYEDRVDIDDRILGKRSDWEENRSDDQIIVGSRNRPLSSYFSESFKSNLVVVIIFIPVTMIVIGSLCSLSGL